MALTLSRKGAGWKVQVERDHPGKLRKHLGLVQGWESFFLRGLWFLGNLKDSTNKISEKYTYFVTFHANLKFRDKGQYILKKMFVSVGFTSVFKVFTHIRNFLRIHQRIFEFVFQNVRRHQLLFGRKFRN